MALARVALPIALALTSWATAADDGGLQLERIPGARPLNIVLIVVDDMRYDQMGFVGHPFLETPNLNALARGGAHFRNAFVTTSLCSPSRASILTGQYAHRHRVVDNNNPIPAGTAFFSDYLQAAGYQTAFIGKWHMGADSDAPRRSFDRWVSFRGQGSYLPEPNGLNVDGEHVAQKGYITDELTEYAVDWLRSRPRDRPFLLYLSHKAVHAIQSPAPRHKGRYKDIPFTLPPTAADTPENRAGKPRWVRDQRNSWHGIDFAFHGRVDMAEFYRDSCETLLAVDDSVGRIVGQLRDLGRLDSTLIVFLSDNGYLFGEHGLIDKRTAYEESIRIPMLMHCPALFRAGTVVEKMAANIDLAPTILEAAGLEAPRTMDGRSLIPIARGQDVPWRDALLYEYFWERNYPQTPTMHAIRTDRYKYIHYHGVWDIDELYDVVADPRETKNLLFEQAHEKRILTLTRQLFEMLGATQGMSIPMLPDRGGPLNLRRIDGSPPADFPPQFMRKK